jgi:hypothetical protein
MSLLGIIWLLQTLILMFAAHYFVSTQNWKLFNFAKPKYIIFSVVYICLLAIVPNIMLLFFFGIALLVYGAFTFLKDKFK